MTELPSAAKAVLQAARTAHDPSDQEVARSLARLSASLTFAAEPSVGVGESLQAGPGVTVEASAGLFTAKLAKLSLVLAALGGALGGAYLMVAPASRAPHVQSAVEAEAAAVRSPTSDAAAVRGLALQTNVQAPEPGAQAPVVQPALPTATQAAESQRAVADAPRRASVARARATAGTPARRAARAAEAAVRAPVVAPSVNDGATAPKVDPETEPSASPAAVAGQDPAPVVDERRPKVQPPSQASAPTELALIDGAAQRLRRGDAEGALRLLDEHLALYPAGVLRTERAGLRVLSLCASGRVGQGRLERAAFLRDAAGTPLSIRVRRACGGGEER